MNRLKKYIFICLLIGCLIPAIQKQFPFIKSADLKGWFLTMEIPAFTWKSWFSGEFQSTFDKSLELNIGLRSALVRVNNQINYSLFNFSTAKTILIGKGGYLFEEPYVNAHMGLDNPDSNLIKLKIEKAEYLHRELEKRGKHLLILLAPGKASFYPEYIPYERYPESKQNSNYEIYSKLLMTSELNYIDFSAYFRKLKNKTPHPLYPKQGTHWSVYGASLAMDSLLKYIRHNFNYNLPQFRVKELEQPEGWRETDYDIGTGMNLMFPMKHDKLAYPIMEFDTDSNLVRPVVLTVGDSYFWTFVSLGLNTKAFKNHEFWYYNKVAYIDGVGEKAVEEKNTANELFKKDIIIIIQTELYCRDFGMGFIESAYEQLKNKQ